MVLLEWNAASLTITLANKPLVFPCGTMKTTSWTCKRPVFGNHCSWYQTDSTVWTSTALNYSTTFIQATVNVFSPFSASVGDAAWNHDHSSPPLKILHWLPQHRHKGGGPQNGPAGPTHRPGDSTAAPMLQPHTSFQSISVSLETHFCLKLPYAFICLHAISPLKLEWRSTKTGI